jgi:hypothetical protein
LHEEIKRWEQKEGRDERERKEGIVRYKQQLREELVRNDIINGSYTKINLSKKPIKMESFDLLFEIIPKPDELMLNAHQLTKQQLDKLC